MSIQLNHRHSALIINIDKKCEMSFCYDTIVGLRKFLYRQYTSISSMYNVYMFSIGGNVADILFLNSIFILTQSL